MKRRRQIWFTTKQTCKILSVHRVTLYDWARTGKIKYSVLPDGSYRFSESEIDRLLKPVGKKAEWDATADRIIKECIIVRS